MKHLVAFASLFLALTGAASAQLTQGAHYELMRTPQPTASAKKVEVIEFFWYACPHCRALQPSLSEWLKRKPADVDFKRMPAVLADHWGQLAHTFYTFEALGVTEKLHEPLFQSIHQLRDLDPRGLPKDPNPLFDWAAKKGVDRQKFVEAYNSPAVASRTQRAKDLTFAYGVEFTPVLAVDGRYIIAPSMKGNSNPDGSVNYDKFFQSLDQLIVQARAKPRAAK
jgi:thiol:disulfide interchange protein DsbA